MSERPYWLRKYDGHSRRAASMRRKAETAPDRDWVLACAKGEERAASRCYAKWREENPCGEDPDLTEAREALRKELEEKRAARAGLKGAGA